MRVRVRERDRVRTKSELCVLFVCGSCALLLNVPLGVRLGCGCFRYAPRFALRILGNAEISVYFCFGVGAAVPVEFAHESSQQ